MVVRLSRCCGGTDRLARCTAIHQEDAQPRSATGRQLGYNLYPLPLLAPDGKIRATNCANTEGSLQNYLAPPETTTAVIAVSAFVETQTEALATSAKGKSKTRKQVATKVRQTIEEMEKK